MFILKYFRVLIKIPYEIFLDVINKVLGLFFQAIIKRKLKKIFLNKFPLNKTHVFYVYFKSYYIIIT